MIISKDGFKRLVSEYIDGELSVDKTQQLFDCIRSNPQAKDYFLRSCAMHKTMCKLYGRKVVFTKIAGLDIEKLIEPPKRSKIRAVSEWSAIACLLASCAVFVYIALSPSKAEALEDDSKIQSPTINYKAHIRNSIKADDSEASIIEVVPERLIFKAD